MLKKHIGGLLSPPFSLDRVIGYQPASDNADNTSENIIDSNLLETHDFELHGESWLKGIGDIVISGLGWVCITGPGLVKIRVTAPKGVDVTIRKPLLPFEAWDSTASFTGGRWVQKQSATSRETRKYGWRA